MFARRASAAPCDDAQQTPLDADRPDTWEESRSFWSVLRPGPLLSRLLLFAPLVGVGFLVVWSLRPEPPQPPAVAPQPVKRVPEATAETRESAGAPRIPSPPKQTVRQEAAEVKPPAKGPEPAAALAVADVPAAPLGQDEIKGLQAKLGGLGFGPGAIDGVLGPQTQAAARRYAQSRGLGNPDAMREVLSHLEAEASGRR